MKDADLLNNHTNILLNKFNIKTQVHLHHTNLTQTQSKNLSGWSKNYGMESSNSEVSNTVLTSNDTYKLVLNGHDRFAAKRLYFTRTQIWQHHTEFGACTEYWRWYCLQPHLPLNLKNTNHQEHAISQESITQDLLLEQQAKNLMFTLLTTTYSESWVWVSA